MFIGIIRLVLAQFAQFAKFAVLHECCILFSEQPPLTPTQPHAQPPKLVGSPRISCVIIAGMGVLTRSSVPTFNFLYFEAIMFADFGQIVLISYRRAYREPFSI